MSDNPNICGAKTRKGTPCQKAPIKDKKRCRLHGGLSIGAKKGNQYARKHGVYSKFISDDEQAWLDDVSLDDVDSELRLCKVKLMRALELEKKQESQSESDKMELVAQTMQIIKDGGEGGGEMGDSRQQMTKSFAKTNVGGLIDRLVGRISALTSQRQELLSKSIDLQIKQMNLQDLQNLRDIDENKPTTIELVAPDLDDETDE